MSDHALIERFGLSFEQEGLPRIAGRIMGFLMLHKGPCTLDDLAEQLQISKTSASTNARLLEQLGLLDQIAKPGDRRDYYELAEDPGERMFALAKRRMLRFRDLLCDAAATTIGKDTAGQSRVCNMQRFYDFLLHDIDERMQTWQTTMGRKSSASDDEAGQENR
jgi:DNA-binding MarR family transcriptional regulator